MLGGRNVQPPPNYRHVFPPGPPPPPKVYPCDIFTVLLFASTSAKPLQFNTVAELATNLVRRGDGAPLDGADMPVAGLGGEPRSRMVVGVWTLNPGGGRNVFLGYAWLGKNRGLETLRAALQRVEHDEAAA